MTILQNSNMFLPYCENQIIEILKDENIESFNDENYFNFLTMIILFSISIFL